MDKTKNIICIYCDKPITDEEYARGDIGVIYIPDSYYSKEEIEFYHLNCKLNGKCVSYEKTEKVGIK